MAPVDNQQQQIMAASAAPHPQAGGGTISLATLIDFIVQRTYHEITVLSELLPRKTDMERKIEIVQFASRTRQLFVRLLALVKWANSAGKVDRCGLISNFLDQQAMLFVDTADMLAKLSRETLVHGRLPNFSLPCAIDVLVTGSYPRLPTCIREKIVPPDPITAVQKHTTLKRLGQIIQHRLVTCDLPPQLHKLKIENGRVKFHVDHEFEVTLTIMGDGVIIPWRLLDIDILVEDHETGDGKALVHSMQIHYIHQLIQSRLLENDRPLHDLYNLLHSFCQSLQLEVLHSQTQRLLGERLGEYARIDEYLAGKCLLLSYWRDANKKHYEASQKVFKLSVHIDEQDVSKPLQVTHVPSLLEQDSIKVGQAIRSDHLSIEKLLVQSIGVRSQAKLKELQKELQEFVNGPCDIGEIPPVMYIPLLEPHITSEMLRISVDMQRGTFLASVAQYPGCEMATDIEDCLNNEKTSVVPLLTSLKLWLAMKRCEKSIQHLSALACHHLPIVNLSDHPLAQLGPHKLFIRVAKQSNSYVVVDTVENPDHSVKYRYYFLEVLPDTYKPMDGENMDGVPQLYLTAGHLTELDTFVITHGPCTNIKVESESPEKSLVTKKRKLYMEESTEPVQKKSKLPPYFVPELTHMLALCEEEVPFISLSQRLMKRDLSHQGIQVDGNGSCLCLTLLDLPFSSEISPAVIKSLKSNILSCKFRMQKKVVRIWLVELMFTSSPIQSTNPKECGPVHRVYLQYDLMGPDNMSKLVTDLQDDLNAIARLYGAVVDFAETLNDCKTNLHSLIEVKTYSFKRLVIAYGPGKNHNVSIQWKSPPNEGFSLSFGTHGPTSTSCNPHALVAAQLQKEFNIHKSVTQLVQVLNDTVLPLTAISRLNTTPILGLQSRMNQPVPSFMVIPQSPVHYRIAFRNVYCIDVHCRDCKLLAIRDGAYSLFDTSKAVDGFNPIPGLKAFLNIYVDETVTAALSRRRSVTEDDNPPSPVGMDMDSFMVQPQSHTGSPRQKQDGLRFHSPMTPPSNPHTPASPTANQRMQMSYSPAAAFPLASPPSLHAPTPSPMMGTPSPGNILTSGSPGTANLHVPSPSSFVPTPSPQMVPSHMMPSPANPFLNPQSHEVGSPYPNPSSQNISMPSPGGRWPASPSMPGPSPVSRHSNVMSPGNPALHSPQNQNKLPVSSHPSRTLPQRSWAASIPTVLSHEALNKLLMPAPTPQGQQGTGFLNYCPLEKFLGCVFMRRHLQRLVQAEEGLHPLPCTEPGVILFKGESLQFRANLNMNTFQMLHLKSSPLPEFKEKWTSEELQIIEKFFEIRVAGPPYKPNSLTAFGRLLGAPFRILKDCVQLLRLELVSDHSLKWSLQWCLTISPATPITAMAGTSAIIIKSNKILIMLQLTRMGGPPVTQSGDAQTVIVPLLYDTNTNITSLAEQRNPQAPAPPANIAISNMLKRFAEFNPKMNECSLYPAVRELLANLVIPM
ncbi:mediator of RNA polymerase II transcription subunit 14-like isoform X2 [Tubulanus polymorphus]|uniref:mediator of RNA polymerase II transcription subunit 14-like isoform X2 n=1 Tax=Tubulanus polymorphus TaxID=672921 RepID=UPI003DA2BD57